MRQGTTWAVATSAAILGCFGAAGTASAALFINVGDVELQPDTPGQTWQVHVTSDAGNVAVNGLEFGLQVGDGGAGLGGNDVGPVISGVDLITGTSFDVPSAVQQSIEDQGMAVLETVDLAGTVDVPGTTGLVATVTFDTTGLTANDSWALLMSGVADIFDTAYVLENGDPVEINITNGTVSIVPEPSAAVGAGLLAGAMLLRRRRAGC